MDPTTPIAVVALGGVFPGAADLAAYWRNIIDGRNAIGKIPARRWVSPPDSVIADRALPDRALTRSGALVSNIPPLPENLAVDHQWVASLDPVYRMAIFAGASAWETCRREPLNLARVGVVLAALALPTDATSGLAARLVVPTLTRRLFGAAPDAPPLTQAEPSGLPGFIQW